MNYYYSKFDNMEWSWWDEKGMPDGTKALLESVNRQLGIITFPAKYLLFLSIEQYFVLVSERSHLDRDSGGRPFSIRHFMLVNKEELHGEDILKNILESFIEPTDPKKPVVPGDQLRFAAKQDDADIFEALVTTLPEGNKLCIVNNQIDNYPDNDKAGITALNFINFPEAAPLIQTLQLLPFPLLKRVSFCLNYENNLINISQHKLAEVDIVLCGKKTLVENTFKVDHDIYHHTLSSQGFVVTNKDEWEITPSARHSFFKFMQEQRAEPQGRFNDILLAWDRENATADITSAFKFCIQLFELVEGKELTPAQIPVIESIIQLKALTKPARHELFHKLLNTLPPEETVSQLYKYAKLASQVGLDLAAFPELPQKLVSAEPSLAQCTGMINNTGFYSLHEGLRNTLLELFAAKISSWKEFSGDACIQLLEKHQSEFKIPELPGIWKELVTSTGISFGPADFPKLRFLYRISPDEAHYSRLLAQQFSNKWDEQWLKEASQQKLKLNPDLSNLKELKDLMHVSTLFQQYTDEISAKKKQEVAAGIKKELSGSWSVVDLVNLNNSPEGAAKRNKTAIRERLVEVIRSKLDKDPGTLLENLKEIRSMPGSQEISGNVFDKLYKERDPQRLNSRMLLNMVQLYQQTGEKQDKREKKLAKLATAEVFEWLPDSTVNRSLLRELKRLNINIPPPHEPASAGLAKIISFFKKIFHARVHKK